MLHIICVCCVFFPFVWSITGIKTCIQFIVKPYIQYLLYYCWSDTDPREEIEHDVNTSAPKLDEWKAHILRAAHQDNAKRDIIDHLKQDHRIKSYHFTLDINFYFDH